MYHCLLLFLFCIPHQWTRQITTIVEGSCPNEVSIIVNYLLVSHCEGCVFIYNMLHLCRVLKWEFHSDVFGWICVTSGLLVTVYHRIDCLDSADPRTLAMSKTHTPFHKPFFSIDIALVFSSPGPLVNAHTTCFNFLFTFLINTPHAWIDVGFLAESRSWLASHIHLLVHFHQYHVIKYIVNQCPEDSRLHWAAFSIQRNVSSSL